MQVDVLEHLWFWFSLASITCNSGKRMDYETRLCMDNEIVQANTETAGQALVNYDPLGKFVYSREGSWYSSSLFLDG